MTQPWHSSDHSQDMGGGGGGGELDRTLAQGTFAWGPLKARG